MERKDYKKYVNNHYMTRDSVVPYYVDLIFRTLSDPFHDDIKRVNNLILRKWKPSGLLYIKDKAWKKVIQWNDKQK